MQIIDYRMQITYCGGDATVLLQYGIQNTEYRLGGGTTLLGVRQSGQVWTVQLRSSQ